jgi:hypothetical protein
MVVWAFDAKTHVDHAERTPGQGRGSDAEGEREYVAQQEEELAHAGGLKVVPTSRLVGVAVLVVSKTIWSRDGRIDPPLEAF